MDDEQLYSFVDNKKIGFKNKDGEVIIKPQYDDAHDFSYCLARVCVNGKWGYVNKKGEEVIKAEWNRAFNFNEKGFAEVSNSKGQIFLIDKRGNIIKQLN